MHTQTYLHKHTHTFESDREATYCHFIHTEKHGARWQGPKTVLEAFFQSHSPELAIVLGCPSALQMKEKNWYTLCNITFINNVFYISEVTQN